MFFFSGRPGSSISSVSRPIQPTALHAWIPELARGGSSVGATGSWPHRGQAFPFPPTPPKDTTPTPPSSSGGQEYITPLSSAQSHHMDVILSRPPQQGHSLQHTSLYHIRDHGADGGYTLPLECVPQPHQDYIIPHNESQVQHSSYSSHLNHNGQVPTIEQEQPAENLQEECRPPKIMKNGNGKI